MGSYSSKIDRDTAKKANIKILKYDNFCLKIVFFLTKTVVFQNFTFFIVSWSIFEIYRPILPFWNSQSFIYNILLLEKYAMNSITEIKEILCVLFLLPDSKYYIKYEI